MYIFRLAKPDLVGILFCIALQKKMLHFAGTHETHPIILSYLAAFSSTNNFLMDAAENMPSRSPFQLQLSGWSDKITSSRKLLKSCKSEHSLSEVG
ncbi:hypothetical protein HanXRQr2_Chr10g0465171 [Helianthus annuus]|uniref:Uncharacterized protein n=1 Tax=Helianthus annuus TaxID=4232 RepID=A0A9K3I1I1_HELAN|nr:hypothetical protein HanXRQr2_Chr10g0465171 [Helianthus annuus]KAJ0885782.1 hypothetical protein HanPSC8_Chr10g0448971 [Helianthus annuus]